MTSYVSLQWLKVNNLVANPSKFQFMLLGIISKHNLSLKVYGITVKATNEVKLIGVIIHQHLILNII